MKECNKINYLGNMAARLAVDEENRKWLRCKVCGLKVKASGKDAEERMERHCAGFHCRPSSVKRK